jgi:hypothetical protein
VASTNYASDLQDLGALSSGSLKLTSPINSVIGVAAADPDIKPGAIAMSHSWGGLTLSDEKVRDIDTPTNQLVASAEGTDRVTGLPVMSAIPNAARTRSPPSLSIPREYRKSAPAFSSLAASLLLSRT